MSYNPTMNDKYFRRQAKFWLWAAGIVFVLALFVWLAMRAPTSLENKEDEIESKDIALPARIDDFTELSKEVKPIDFSTLVRDLRSYPAEFKDKIYYENMSKSYTIELMDVAQHEVIVDYLNGRSERKNFAYFRYLVKKKPHYVLTFGKFASADEAAAAIASNDFGLPESIKAKVVKVSDYLPKIDHYMREESIKDIATAQTRRVHLQATRKEIPARAATRADEDLARRSEMKSKAYLQEQANRQQDSVPKAAPKTPTAPTAQPQAAPEPVTAPPTAQPQAAPAEKRSEKPVVSEQPNPPAKPSVPVAPTAVPTAPTAAPEGAPTAQEN